MNQIARKNDPTVNQVRKTGDKRSWIDRLILQWKHFRMRSLKATNLAIAFWRAREIEQLLQQFEQKRNDLEYGREVEQFIYTKGFCEGIKYCMDGKWHEETDRTFIAHWRDALSR